VALPLARTNLEAHLYMDLHPCACGESAFDRASAVVEAGGDLASRYSGACARCGAEREFRFRIPERILMPIAGEVRFGGESPSELLDAGMWLWVADRYASRYPADPRRLDGPERRHARRDLATATAAVDEVVKFIPAGGEAVPDAAFWSAQGLAVRADEPGRFYRDRLEAVRGTYQELLATFDA
jgi:hypothetical protein